METYRTIRREGQDEFVERRSRFIGAICPVTTEQQAIAFLNDKKKAQWDATHNVYACIPVLDVLQKSGLTDCAVVVTRYFGGVLLGAGGLVRAYSHGASLAVQAGEPVEMRPCTVAQIVAPYAQYGLLERLIPAIGGVIDDTDFTDQVTVTLHLEDTLLPRLQQQLTEQTAGQLSASVTDHTFAPFDV